MPTANTKPFGSKATTGLPATLICPSQFGDLKSHSMRLLSNDALTNISSTGDLIKETTLFVWPMKYRIYLF